MDCFVIPKLFTLKVFIESFEPIISLVSNPPLSKGDSKDTSVNSRKLR